MEGFSINLPAVFTGAFEVRVGSCTGPPELVMLAA